MTKTLSSLAPLAGALLLLGCSELDNCPEGQDPIPFEGGRTNTPSLLYESSAWDQERQAFPAKTCVRFVHGLGTTPELVQSYVSFERTGSDVSENAGNQGRIECVDDTEIVIRNDTCEEQLFIRVVAHASGSATSEKACDPLVAELCKN